LQKNKILPNKLFIIAEIANSHTGSVIKLKQIIKKIQDIKPHAIKFQLFKASELLESNHPEFKLYKKLEISDNEWKKIFEELKKTKIKIFVDVFSISRAKFAKKYVDGFKIHSSDINNFELLKYVSNTKKPILLSCSGCNNNEIDDAVKLIQKQSNSQIILMHGFQGFPTKIEEVNFKRIKSLQKKYRLPVGYMDHINGDASLAPYLPLVALGLGCNIIEKHITLNRDLKEEDFQSSLNPNEFKIMKKFLVDGYKSLGSNSFLIKNNELNYRKNMKKRILSKSNIPKNHKINKNNIVLKRSKSNAKEISLEKIIGSTSKKYIPKNIPLSSSNIIPKPIVIAAIACRVNSFRLYAKPLQVIEGITILEHIVSQLNQCKLIDHIVLAISEKPENELFIEFARKFNLKFVVGDDIDVLHRLITAGELVDADVILRVTSEDPIKHWKIIDSSIKEHIRKKKDYSECISQVPEGTGFELIQLNALKISHKKGIKKHRSELVTLYINENKKKFKINSIKVEKKFTQPKIRLTVDNPEDLILVRKIWSKMIKNQLPALEKIIQLINNDSEIRNAHKAAIKKAKS